MLILQNLGAKVWKTISKTRIKRIFFLKMWKMWKSQLSKSVGIQEEYVFSTFPQFSKTFWTYISQKIFQVFICGKKAKIDYYPHQATIVSSTFLKSKMWKMWKPAVVAAYFNLKMWKEMCNQHDDRKRFLG